MIFDEGYYEPVNDIKKALKEGSIKFVLKGKRLKGLWTLVHFKEDNWLLIKEKDKFVDYKDINSFKTSIKTGRTMEEIENGIIKRKNTKDSVEGIKISNPDKLIYNKPKITKMDVVK